MLIALGGFIAITAAIVYRARRRDHLTARQARFAAGLLLATALLLALAVVIDRIEAA